MALGSNRSKSVVIAGVGNTAYGRLPEHNAASLGVWALREAAKDAGIGLNEIDGVVFHRLTDYQKFVRVTGMTPHFLTAAPGAGRMTGGAIQIAVQAILSGMLNTVALVYGNDGRSAGARYGGKEDTYGTEADQLWFPYGMTSPGAVHAMQFQRHAALYGTKPEQLGTIALTFRRHARMNPTAVMKKLISMDDYLAAPYVCEPLRLLDYCLINDGGVAMILTRSDRARDMRSKPVYVHGLAQTSRLADGELPDDFGYSAMQASATRAFSMAGVWHKDIDALMIYDNFTPTVIFTLEGFGFCPRGEGGRFVESGCLDIAGEYPTNTNGGQLSESYMQGWGLNVEAVRQLRGDAGERQVADAKFVQFLQGGPLSTSIIYGNEPV